jgi:hypothetical protein
MISHNTLDCDCTLAYHLLLPMTTCLSIQLRQVHSLLCANNKCHGPTFSSNHEKKRDSSDSEVPWHACHPWFQKELSIQQQRTTMHQIQAPQSLTAMHHFLIV